MVLLMPAEVISTVHQFAAACEKYKGIKFTNKDGNIINDDNNPYSVENEENGNPEITGVDITGVHENYEQNMVKTLQLMKILMAIP